MPGFFGDGISPNASEAILIFVERGLLTDEVVGAVIVLTRSKLDPEDV
jgi:hypothetical protein